MVSVGIEMRRQKEGCVIMVSPQVSAEKDGHGWCGLWIVGMTQKIGNVKSA